MNKETYSQLTAVDGKAVALKDVAVHARLRDLLAEFQIEQRYANTLGSNIEAVYTFPLPLGAVLLDLELELGERTLVGRVVEATAAEREYEEAITDGNTAVMLTQSGPGLYTMNVGNLLAGENCLIRYRYALALRWFGDMLRLVLPTSVAPRYGSPTAAGLAPHQVPQSSLTVEYPLTVQIDVEGELAKGKVSSPTHPLTVQVCAIGLQVGLAGTATLDHDLVLTLQAEQHSSCLLSRDGEGYAALAFLRIPPLANREQRALHLKVLIDCSGSMNGVSITQARKAALEILNQLRPGDWFSITLFGGRHHHVFKTLVPADDQHLVQACQAMEKLNADMGGTETGKALEACYALRTETLTPLTEAEHGDPVVLLITDGEVWDFQPIVRKAAQSGHQLFTVGVGLTVAAEFVEQLAQVSGGACELVPPQDGMGERILSQFHRMRQPRLAKLSLDWGVTPKWSSPLPSACFAGDTVLVYAGFSQAAEFTPRLEATFTDETTITVEARSAVLDLPTLPRLAAAARIDTLALRSDQVALAVQYQLLTANTHFILVLQREHGIDTLPELQIVPQMHAVALGGAPVEMERRISGLTDRAPVTAARKMSAAKLSKFGGILLEEPSPETLRDRPATFVDALMQALVSSQRYTNVQAVPITITSLTKLGLPAFMVDGLQALVNAGFAENDVVTGFLLAFSQIPVFEQQLDRGAARLLKARWKREGANASLLACLETALKGSDSMNWRWAPPDISTI